MSGYICALRMVVREWYYLHLVCIWFAFGLLLVCIWSHLVWSAFGVLLPLVVAQCTQTLPCTFAHVRFGYFALILVELEMSGILRK
jgi:hypothetical protein